jgi:predicted N-acetyltransferase YhbS
MNLHCLESSPPEWLGVALEEFEQQFAYPLGAGASFHVTHGRQYVAFFQAMGEVLVVVAEKDGDVLGTVAVIRRRLRCPDGSESSAYYVCDLKIAPRRTRGMLLARLMHAVREHIIHTGVAPVYGIVMDGTPRIPGQYTGRVGIPLFEPVAKLAVLKVPVDANTKRSSSSDRVGIGEVEALRERLLRGVWSTPMGTHERRSGMVPVALASSDGRACGIVEDTRLGKRLVLGDGQEMEAAHLSSLACDDVKLGLEIVGAALEVARQQGFPALFLALPRSVRFVPMIHALTESYGALDASATIHGTGFPPGVDAEWWIDTSEI